MKRVYRNDMPQAQKDKIAAAQQGRTLSQSTKDKISKSMRQYWAGLPVKPTTDNPNTPKLPTAPALPNQH